MTTQDSSALDEKEAERLASMIRPAWEVEEDDAAPAAAIPATAKSADVEAGAIAAKLATDPGAAPPRDTVIDGSPTIGVGATDPGPPPEAAVAGAPKIIDPAPQPAGPTKLGMGDDIAEGIAQVDSGRAKSSAKATIQGVAPGQPPSAPASSSSVPPPDEAVAAEPPARKPDIAGLRRTDVMEARAVSPSSPPLAPVRPQPASFSKADDPIELPVKKSSNATLIIVGLVAAVAAIAGGVMLFSGDEPKPPAKTAPATTTTAEAKPTATATTKPIETAAQTATPLPTASAEPTATASATATATASETATAVAKVDPPKPEVTNKPPPPKQTATGGSKPPPKGGGGIIRDTPF